MKPQFTEEEARKLHDDCIMDFGVTSKEAFINGLKSCGYIRKSDLEILIEECDQIYDEQFEDKTTTFTMFEIKLLELVRRLKAELNKRRDI